MFNFAQKFDFFVDIEYVEFCLLSKNTLLVAEWLSAVCDCGIS